MMQFKDRLKELRLNNNMSQSQFAEKLGMAKSTISAYETGAIQPSIKVLFRIADVFNIPLDYFYNNLEMPAAKYANTFRVPVLSKIPADIDIVAELSSPHSEMSLDILYYRAIHPDLQNDHRKYFIYEDNNTHYTIRIQSTFTEDDTILACVDGGDARLYTYNDIISFDNVKIIGVINKY